MVTKTHKLSYSNRVSMTQKTPENLMIAYQNGDLEAFQLLYKQYEPRVYGYLYSKVKTPENRDEIFQLIFLKLHRTKNQYDPQYKFEQWLFVICKSVLLDYFKSQKKHAALDLSEMSQNDPALSYAPLQETHMNIVKPDLSVLTNEQKTVVELRIMDEKTYQEIALKLNKTEQSIRKTFSRAIQKLKTKATQRQ